MTQAKAPLKIPVRFSLSGAA